MSQMYTELFNPIYGTVNGLPVIIIGALTYHVEGNEALVWMAVDDDGLLMQVPPAQVNVDVRFREGRWQDVSPGAPEARDEEA